jgi:hypothetical protein
VYRAAVFFVLAGVVSAATPDQRPGRENQGSADPCAITGVARIVAVGDVHGAYDGFVRILRAAKIIDERDRWIAGETHLIQTGDVLDRGTDSRRVMDLLRRLERDAQRRRGRVLALVGNHEVMRLMGELRDMTPSELENYRTPRSADVRTDVRSRWLQTQRDEAKKTGTTIDEKALSAEFDKQTPLGLIEMLAAFSPEGDYGKWIRGHSAAAQVNGILFLHGGVSPRVAPLGCKGINAGVRADLTTGMEELRKAPLAALAASEDGPLWYRGLARGDEATLVPEVKATLEALKARAIVIGHTVTETGRITPRAGGLVVQIDTGMLTSVYKMGRPSALEITGDTWTAIYEDGRETLARDAGSQRSHVQGHK